MRIFDKLWQLNSGAINKHNSNLFDPHDYRNTKFNISRKDAQKLIEGLGGHIMRIRGKTAIKREQFRLY